MSISQIARSISQSATLRLNETAAILRAKGDPVIHLGGGEPKSKPPLEALTTAAGLLNSGEVRYTPPDGIPALKKAIIRYTEEFYNRKVEPENVMASSGAKQAIMVCLQAILNPQEEVIFPAPYWVSYPEMVKLCGGIPVPVTPEDGTFHPRIQDIEEKIGSLTRAIMINSPNNPSGTMYSEQFISDIVQLCEKRGLYLIMDDIYQRLIFNNLKPINCYKYAKDFSETSKLVVINGVSKQYAMTGFRIGWSIANKRLTEVMTNIQGHQTSGPSALLQHAAVGALRGLQSHVENLRVSLENNRNVMITELKSFAGVHLIPPDGTFYCFPDFSVYRKDSVKLAQFLLDKVQVVTVPGIEFGMEGYLRVSFCGSVKDITSGIERMKWALDLNSPNELFIGERKLVRDWA
ncbi:MAG: pyridoxal phosphate-dependent aminotransferase [Candidatus Eisenbacteria bacterium]|uniref:Aminotransferase n=1 Tax=Eiseniibacteriota bacterium TaxID=2212470 RepID=A0A948W7B3_UNCEI|nr:pyridoxal phosphate-dependent aminotransferase [Candidatus Eisenbacteria bacterium]MBU1947706.1 pyridoxal phosphate-dependent aminotransferase [Candidatus Eisenbacteria bacterium]MBU2692050.1 pyridoxal phosphate-dependent aminotransferase [Candidatus Eisenbacteria bacterium]